MNVYVEWRTAGFGRMQRTLKMLLAVLLFCIVLTGITMYTAPEEYPAASDRAESAGAEADMSFVTDMAGTVASAAAVLPERMDMSGIPEIVPDVIPADAEAINRQKIATVPETPAVSETPFVSETPVVSETLVVPDTAAEPDAPVAHLSYLRLRSSRTRRQSRTHLLRLSYPGHLSYPRRLSYLRRRSFRIHRQSRMYLPSRMDPLHRLCRMSQKIRRHRPERSMASWLTGTGSYMA